MLSNEKLTFNVGKKKQEICPLCGATSKIPFVPFCSSRCAQLDLSKWLNEYYSIPVIEEENN